MLNQHPFAIRGTIGPPHAQWSELLLLPSSTVMSPSLWPSYWHRLFLTIMKPLVMVDGAFVVLLYSYCQIWVPRKAMVRGHPWYVRICPCLSRPTMPASVDLRATRCDYFLAVLIRRGDSYRFDWQALSAYDKGDREGIQLKGLGQLEFLPSIPWKGFLSPIFRSVRKPVPLDNS